ncbi:MAG: NYN domain-containing protein, partial [Acidimicrobiales bacterium]
MTKRRATAYIDGFNFYNGTVKAEPSLKWLDVPKLCEQLLRGSHCDLRAVRYYTAKVFDIPAGGGQRRRQEVYLRALGTLPQVEVVFGQFKKRDKIVRLHTPLPGGVMKARAKTIEEKGSDVNLATDLLWDVLH